MSRDPDSAALSPTPGHFRRACARYATGVTVITTFAADNTPQGLTANSFTSVSMNPSLISFCLDHRSNVFAHFRIAKVFAVNVLDESQEELSIRFSMWDREERFEGIGWRVGEIGAPLIEGSLAWIECTRWKIFDAGDHSIFVGQARKSYERNGRPLLYYASRYRQLEEPE